MKRILVWLAIASVLAASGGGARADGARDNDASQVRPIPPPGNDLDPAERASLEAGVATLGREIEALRQQLAGRQDLLALLPDVQIFYNAVRYPLAHHETIEVGIARRALARGLQRAADLRAGRTPWINVTGARGYVSRIDGSVQPYVVCLPPNFRPAEEPGRLWRIDMWGHGRDELLTELRFVEMEGVLHDLKYLNASTEPPDRLLLCTYNRYINASRFAGEVDGLEALAEAGRRYPIDPRRRVTIGFSLGGTAAWQYALHFPDLWAAASPAAGLAEAREFLKVFQKEDVSGAPWYQQVLWHWYDATGYAANLASVPVVAYGGELDPQKQASDMMVAAAAAAHVPLERVVGRGMGHHYTPEAKAAIDEKLDAWAAKGRDPFPSELHFTTWTLRYPKLDWLTIQGLEHHWQQAQVDGRLSRNPEGKVNAVELRTSNVTRLRIDFPASELSPLEAYPAITVDINGTKVNSPPFRGYRGYSAVFVSGPQGWTLGDLAADRGEQEGLRKKPGLQGPIDDAFMDRFLIVRPTGQPLHAATGARVQAECDHAIEHWFRQFRGEPRVKNDIDVTPADIASGNLVLFGDPSSNSVLKSLADRLPLHWKGDSIVLGDRVYPADRHMPALIYPNPLDPTHYIVLNSGFTYREYDYLNNARQTPKLPDYAVIDTREPATSRSPGKVVAAGFFGEQWELLPDDGKAASGWRDPR